MVTEPVVALVGHNDTGLFRLDGGVGEILRWWDVRRILNTAALKGSVRPGFQESTW